MRKVKNEGEQTKKKKKEKKKKNFLLKKVGHEFLPQS